MKHIVGFSGGAASSVVGKIVAEQYHNDTVLLFHNTHTEPADNDRFRKDVSDYIGLPITDYSDGRNIWQVFNDTGLMGNTRITPCSRILKQERSLQYLKDNQPAILYVGFTVEEWERAQRTYARYLVQCIDVKFPLIEEQISKDECLHRIRNCWGIRLPYMYEWAEHANCVPCVKGGKAYWGLVYLNANDAWKFAKQFEKETKNTILKDGSLEETLPDCLRLAKKWLRDKALKKNQAPLIPFPCECAL